MAITKDEVLHVIRDRAYVYVVYRNAHRASIGANSVSQGQRKTSIGRE